MKLRSPIPSGTALAAVCGIALACSVAAIRAQADEWDKKTILTVDQPIQVADTYLDPGTYVFKLANSSSDRHIVQIFNADQSHIINTVLAFPNYRLQPTGNSRFTFYETPPGTAKALHAWFYPGDNFGQEFRYPKQLRQLASVQAPPPVQAPAVTQPVQTPAPAPAPAAPAPEPQALNEAPAPPPPAEVAQNTPPPPPAPQAQAAPPAPAQPQELPKTASPFASIGLAGLASLSLFGLVKARGLVRR